MTPPNVPFIPAKGGMRGTVGADNVGDGADLMSAVAGTISRAEGSFPVVTGVTSETGAAGPNDYSLQLNSNFFANATPCTGAASPASCQGWEQFLYVPGQIFIQYWLLQYDNPCPSQWGSDGLGDCYINSTKSTPVPAEPVTDLGNLTLIGQAGSTDTVSMSIGNDTLYAMSQASVLGLSKGWSSAEFNIVGDGNGSQAAFNSGASIVVQTLTDSVSPTTSAPGCQSGGTTGETNNLNLVPGSCCPVGGSSPAIQFLQSDVSGATAQACPLPPERIPVAFQANTNDLWLDLKGNAAGTDLSFGMMPGTVPSLVMPPGGVPEVAFQANTGNLWIETKGRGSGVDQKLAMKAATSPSMALLPGGGVAVAFQANTGNLWIETNGKGADQKLGMMAGTSPSIAAFSDGSVAVAFQANTGNLWLDGKDQKLGMMAGTSPSIVAISDGTVAIAFQANSGDLWLNGKDQKLGMMVGTSPSIAVLSNGSLAIAFQANTGTLWVNGKDQKLAMMAAASPSILPIENGGYQVAFEGNNGDLWLDVNDVGTDQKLGMNTP
jgi:hypothetical protein